MAMAMMLAAALTARAGTEAAGSAAPARSEPIMDRTDFEAFHAETSRPLWSYVLRLVGDGSVAEDVAQESYLRCLTRPCRERDERARRAYLFRIATNLARDRWRRGRFEAPWNEERAANLRVQGPASRIEGAVDLWPVLQALKPRQRALLWLAYVEGYSHGEIAEILGLRLLSVRVLLARARKKMRVELAARGLDHLSPLEGGGSDE